MDGALQDRLDQLDRMGERFFRARREEREAYDGVLGAVAELHHYLTTDHRPPVGRLTLTAEEAARMVGVCRRTVDGWVADGTLPRVPHVARILIPTAAVRALAEGKEG